MDYEFLLNWVMDILIVIGSVLFVAFFFGMCIFVHELGHFLVAKWRGLHVDAFSIGFKKVPFAERPARCGDQQIRNFIAAAAVKTLEYRTVFTVYGDDRPAAFIQ